MTDLPPAVDAGLLSCLALVCAAIAAIDWRHQIIPDGLNIAVALLGLGRAALIGGDAIPMAALQGVVAFSLFWLIRRLYKAIRSFHGLGLGDVKFLGAAGLWVGLEGLAPLVLIACVSALLWLTISRLRGEITRAGQAVAFGPFLSLGLLAVTGASLVSAGS